MEAEMISKRNTTITPQQTDAERIAQLEAQNTELSAIVDALLVASLGG